MESKDSKLADLFIRHRTLAVMMTLLCLYLVSAAAKPQTTGSTEATDLDVGIAQWRQAGGPKTNIQQNTYIRLSEALEALNLDEVALVKVPSFLKNADDVDRIASQFGVDVLVWGWYDEIAVRGYVDLANATEENGMTNSLAAFLKNGGNPNIIQVLNTLSDFDYVEDGVSFCVPRWTP